ncbi:hypothetical protein D018_2678A, partial [Vibrio parahaemolyticus VP2007-007]
MREHVPLFLSCAK